MGQFKDASIESIIKKLKEQLKNIFKTRIKNEVN